MYTYNNTYYTTTTTVDTEALAALLGVTSVIALIMLIIMVIANWKIFTKAGKPGWASIVPFYNMYTLFEVAGMNGWMFLLLLIPFVNIVMAIMLCINLTKAFGKSNAFAVGLVLLNPIFSLILAFGNAKYIGNGNNKTNKANKTSTR